MKKVSLMALLIFWGALLSVAVFPATGMARVFSVFGPENFVRSSGSPVAEVRQFLAQSPFEYDFTLHIFYPGVNDNFNGVVPSALVTLNGQKIVTPDAFNKNTGYIKKEVTLSEVNSLSVKLRGKPGNAVSVVITAQNDEPRTFDFNQPIHLEGIDLFGPDLNYAWDIVSKPTGAEADLSDPHSPAPTFSVDRLGEYVLQLRITGDKWSEVFLVKLIASTPPLQADAYTGCESGANASAVFYNQKLWVFYPTESHDIHYRLWDGTDMAGGYEVDIGGGTVPTTYTQMTPLVAGKRLYLFFTADFGDMQYTSLDPATNKWQLHGVLRSNESWNEETDEHQRYAAVYNPLKQWIEIYWTPDGSDDIYYAYLSLDKNSLPTGYWKGFQRVHYSDTAGGSVLSAVWYQSDEDTGTTYLAFRNSDHAKIHHIQYEASGSEFVAVVQKTDTLDSLTKDEYGPTLVDLGEDQMALIYKTSSSSDLYFRYYDKHSDTWSNSVNTIDCGINDWIPNGAVFYKQVDDERSSLGHRWDAQLQLFYGHDTGFLNNDKEWKMIIAADTVGYWLPIDVTTADFADYERETFYSWPMLALVDMPPFVTNGTDGEYVCGVDEYNCTEAKFDVTGTSAETFAGEVSGGAYVATGNACPLTYQLSAGVSASMSTGTSFTYSSTDFLRQTTKGVVMGFYLAPEFTTYTMQWYEYNGSPTDHYAYPVIVTDTNVIAKRIDPRIGAENCDNTTLPGQPYMEIPFHGGDLTDMERLQTYQYSDDTYINPENYTGLFGQKTVAWDGYYDPASFTFSIEADKTTDVGGYVTMKLGAMASGILGAGVEGSLDINMSTTLKGGVSVTTTLNNEPAAVSGDIQSFYVTGYWLETGTDTDSYWIPLSRRGLGDRPTFITYSVKNISQKQ